MEVKLWSVKQEIETYDDFSELFAIIQATVKLDKAEYESKFQKLIAHFQTISSVLEDIAPSFEHFIDTYQIDCVADPDRLVASGVRATMEYRAAVATSASECLHKFITLMDSFKPSMVAVDEVYPPLSDFSASLNKQPILFEGKMQMREWIARLLGMGAAEELNEQQQRARQLNIVLFLCLLTTCLWQHYPLLVHDCWFEVRM